MHNVYENSVVSVQAIKPDANNETINGAGVDMLEYGAVTFIVVAQKGESANFSIKAQQAQQSDYSDAADLAGTAVSFSTTASVDGVAVLEIRRPRERYVRPVVTVPTLSAAKAVCVIAIKHSPTRVPTTNVTGELHVSPAEGTA